ncbi:MAG: hypothetical protein H7A46_16970 [Verrucomicrobiales bacterium]|nr:hypothetical protein [Verrucomicrobiales bacterium]
MRQSNRVTRRLGRWGMNGVVCLLLALAARADATNRIQRLALDPNTVVTVPVALDRLTTVRFPSPIAGLEAVFIATEPHPEARFLVSFQPGQEFFSLQATRLKVSASLNVIWQHQTYVLELVESEHPCLSLIFEEPVYRPARPTQQVSKALLPVDPSPLPTPERLLALLDTANNYNLLKSQHPGLVAGVERVVINKIQDHGDYATWLLQVLRFPADDTLVFHIWVRNKTDQPIRYVPQSLMVQVGERTYFQSATDADGVLPPQATTAISLAITGSPDGSPNNLSPRNEFRVLLNRFAPEATADKPAAGQSQSLLKTIPAVR